MRYLRLSSRYHDKRIQDSSSVAVNQPDKFVMLKEAMRIIMSKTCIKFVRVLPNKNGKLPADGWVNITGTQNGCYSDLGRSAFGPSILNLNLSKCFSIVGHALHEMLHSLGVYHEHMRPDRDNFINIIWENIKPGNATCTFQKLKAERRERRQCT